MRLTLVVPTRNRADLARRCVTSALAAGHQDVQLIVLENSDRPEISRADFGDDPRVTVLPSERPLAMHANWERGLDVADGEYVAYLSDKDVVLPNALGNAVRALELVRDCQIVAYRKPVYVVPTGQVTHYRASGCVTEYSTREFLAHWYRVPQHYHEMPSIYGAFISRELIRSALAAHSTLFIGNSPDVASAAILCSLTDSWAGWEYQVTVGRYGPWSTGWTAGRYGFLCEASRRAIKEYGRDISAELGLPGVLSTSIVEVLLEAQANHPRTLGEYRIDWDEFLPLLRRELIALDVPESAKCTEWARLYSFRSVAPRVSVVKCDLAWATQHVKDYLHGTSGPASAGNHDPRASTTSDGSQAAAPPPRFAAREWFGHPPGSGTFSVASVDEAVAGLAKLNSRSARLAYRDGRCEANAAIVDTGSVPIS